ncbi:protein SRG1-like, partial [Diospyros lotus]|uniref:protein SRG1-like n=1 Tax=Diospyros lotus TaxID=55363 RepID=UPI002254D1EB
SHRLQRCSYVNPLDDPIKNGDYKKGPKLSFLFIQQKKEDIAMDRLLGGSLPVPCVQELAKQPLSTVPTRYVRPDQDPPFISNPSSLPQAPVINFQSLLSPEMVDSELQKLHNACKDWGFFQLIDHGVSSVVMEKVKLEVQEFFKLPMEEKKRFWQEPGHVEGFGQAFVMSEEQKLDWADMFYMITLPTHIRNPHLFPNLPLPLRNTIEAYTAELRKVGMKLLSLMAKALGMKEEDMMKIFGDGVQTIRIGHYPPCPEPEKVIGLSPHSDASGITILLQATDVEGLQIKKDGKWVPIKPLPDAFIVNIGDSLEILSNGNYQSVEHRAVVNSEKERFSVATFISGNLDGELGPAPSLITPQTPALFKTVRFIEFARGVLSRELRGKSNVNVMRIQRDEQQN